MTGKANSELRVGSGMRSRRNRRNTFGAERAFWRPGIGPTRGPLLMKVILPLACALAFIAIGISAFSIAVDAKRHLSSAGDQMVASLAFARKGEIELARRRVLKGQAELEAAQSALKKPPLRFASSLPLLGDNLAAVESLATAGWRATRAGLELLDLYRELEGVRSRWEAGGAIDLDAFDRIKAGLNRASFELSLALSDLGRSPRSFVVSPIACAKDDGETKLASFKSAVDKGRAIAEALPEILGKRRKRKYFLAVQNNAELRATGGLIGNYGIISAERGKLSLDSFEEIHALKRPGDSPVAAPKEFIGRYGSLFSASPSVWVNANACPDFPTSAAVIAALYKRSTGETVDGVVAVDPIGLSYLLRVTGPVDLPELGVRVGADNAVRWTLSEAYSKYGDRAERKDSLRSLARGVWARVLVGRTGDAASFARVLAQAIKEKHLMLYLTDPKEEGSIKAAGAAGEMKRTRGDYLLVDVENYGMNKVDYYLKESVAHEVELRPDGSAKMVTTIDLFNCAPAIGLPEYVAGRASRGYPSGTNEAYVSVSVPRGSSLTNATLEKKRAIVEISEEQQRSVYSALVRIPPGEKRELRFEYTSPNILIGEGSEREYSLLIQKQPMVNDAAYKVKISSSAYRPVYGSLKIVGSGLEAVGKLTSDVSLTENLRAK